MAMRDKVKSLKANLLKFGIRHNLLSLRSALQTPEFIDVIFPDRTRFPLDLSPSMRIQTECSEADRAAMWASTGTVWSNLGIAEPYWSVLTDDRWRRNKLNGAAALNAFYASGDGDLLRMDA